MKSPKVEPNSYNYPYLHSGGGEGGGGGRRRVGGDTHMKIACLTSTKKGRGRGYLLWSTVKDGQTHY